MESFNSDTENNKKIRSTLGISDNDVLRLKQIDEKYRSAEVSDSSSSSFGDEFDSDGNAELELKIEGNLDDLG